VKFILSTTERINVGNYEFIELSATVEFTEAEADGHPETFGRQQLDVLLRSHRRRAQGLVPENVESFILEHPALEN
jgi:hypothetical protein